MTRREKEMDQIGKTREARISTLCPSVRLSVPLPFLEHDCLVRGNKTSKPRFVLVHTTGKKEEDTSTSVEKRESSR